VQGYDDTVSDQQKKKIHRREANKQYLATEAELLIVWWDRATYRNEAKSIMSNDYGRADVGGLQAQKKKLQLSTKKEGTNGR
jgi:hypothetical protein